VNHQISQEKKVKAGARPCRPRFAPDRLSSMRGASLLEAMIASLIFLIVIAGLLPLIAVTLRGESSNDLYVQANNVARAKIEQIKNLSYAELGLSTNNASCPDPAPGFGPTVTGAIGLGYFEVDPYGDDRFNPGQDFPLSDTVTIKIGNKQVPVIRKVTIEAIDDPADGSGLANDRDQMIDMNLRTVIDYKLVTVTIVFQDPLLNHQIQQSLATIISGLGGDDDTNGTKAKPSGALKPASPSPSGGHIGNPTGAGGRKGRGYVSNWSGS
jgi:hypothetical protein